MINPAIFYTWDFWGGACLGIVVGVLGVAWIVRGERQEGGPPPKVTDISVKPVRKPRKRASS